MPDERACDELTPESESVEWISPRQAALRANVPYRTLYHWIEKGTWPVRVVRYSEHQYRLRLTDFEVWLAARRAEHGET